MGQVASIKDRFVTAQKQRDNDGGRGGGDASSTSFATCTDVSKSQRLGKYKLPPPVVFLPSPYEMPDSKPHDHNNAHEKTILEVIRGCASKRVTHVVEHFTLGAKVVLPGVTFPITGFIDYVMETHTVFPDFHFEYKLIGETSPGVVVAIVQACGTHRGGEYSTRGNPTPMSPRGALCKNDPEIMTIIFQGSKVKECSFLPASPDTRYHGPDGFYQRIVEHDLNRRARKQRKAQLKHASSPWATTA